MAFRSYDPMPRYNDSEAQMSSIAELLIWAFKNPEKAIEIGVKIAVAGGLIWFLGTLFKN